MTPIKLKVSAKVNLFLDITSIADNGFHILDTVMQSVDIFDTLSFEDSDTLEIECPLVPGHNNTAFYAARYFLREIGHKGGIKITIDKSIPMAGGMGGSSADAAGVLYGLNHIFGNPLSDHKLYEIGSKIGSDVNFLIYGGCCRCTGKGDKLLPIENNMNPVYLGVKSYGLLTAKKAYETYDIVGGDHSQADDVLAALRNNDTDSFCSSTVNSLERPCATICPDVEIVKNIFSEDDNCIGSFLTGSGSVYVGIYKNDSDAENAKKYFGDRHCFVFHNTDKSVFIE